MHASSLSIWTEEIQAKSEEWTTQRAIYCDTIWLNHLAHVIVTWQIQKLLCYCTVIALFYFVFEGNFPTEIGIDSNHSASREKKQEIRNEEESLLLQEREYTLQNINERLLSKQVTS